MSMRKMNINWIWDTRLSVKEVRNILKDEKHPKFVIYAAKLLSRVHDTHIVFGFIDKLTFCRKWGAIKKKMVKDKWQKDKIVFWQAIYERIYAKLKYEGIHIREHRVKRKQSVEIGYIANRIREIRKSKGYSQKYVAKKAGVIQQYISKIESGHDNFSIEVLKKITKTLNSKIDIRIVPNNTIYKHGV